MINAQAMLHLIEFDGRNSVYHTMLSDTDQQLTNLLCDPEQLLILDGNLYFFYGNQYETFQPVIELPRDTEAIRVSNLRLLLPGIRITLTDTPRLTEFHRRFKAKIDSL